MTSRGRESRRKCDREVSVDIMLWPPPALHFSQPFRPIMVAMRLPEQAQTLEPEFRVKNPRSSVLGSHIADRFEVELAAWGNEFELDPSVPADFALPPELDVLTFDQLYPQDSSKTAGWSLKAVLYRISDQYRNHGVQTIWNLGIPVIERAISELSQLNVGIAFQGVSSCSNRNICFHQPDFTASYSAVSEEYAIVSFRVPIRLAASQQYIVNEVVGGKHVHPFRTTHQTSLPPAAITELTVTYHLTLPARTLVSVDRNLQPTPGSPLQGMSLDRLPDLGLSSSVVEFVLHVQEFVQGAIMRRVDGEKRRKVFMHTLAREFGRRVGGKFQLLEIDTTLYRTIAFYMEVPGVSGKTNDTASSGMFSQIWPSTTTLNPTSHTPVVLIEAGDLFPDQPPTITLASTTTSKRPGSGIPETRVLEKVATWWRPRGEGVMEELRTVTKQLKPGVVSKWMPITTATPTEAPDSEEEEESTDSTDTETSQKGKKKGKKKKGKKNEQLLLRCETQEQDALAVIAAVHCESEDKDAKVRALQEQVDKEKEAASADKEALVVDYERRISELNSTISEKDAAYKVLQHEHAVVKGFRRKRHEVFNELDTVKRDLAEMERRHHETVARLERKHFEDTMRLQSESERNISERGDGFLLGLGGKLQETTKEIYRENVRMTEALNHHVHENQSLKKQSEQLSVENKQLQGEREIHEAMVREKILQSKTLHQEAQSLESKISSLEHLLGHVVGAYEKERVSLVEQARVKFDDAQRECANHQEQLRRKTSEMKHIRLFFMDALESVRSKLLAEADQAQQGCPQRSQVPPGCELPSTIPFCGSGFDVDDLPHAQRYGARGVDSLYVGKLLDHHHTETPASDFEALPWHDKERVLWLLLAQMNGQTIL
ncbi:hypothetical protein M427DRAFT_45400 [Gonapodya prolifera JEL478]|uniref:Basal body-orientation factor 1 n=1 Tax=Gonapodya prolifera (strain JEL478) TaxID=1344416 RepID=A0A139AB84_GONPJ|nr:hypothetical protein M427DRAFT_45400 [Gonapodya prolifera JEL478]|eukprot:KXS13934.1 hypothetical protein M427DRAFT_45400 [Gonapodya prolifera JEL478]